MTARTKSSADDYDPKAVAAAFERGLDKSVRRLGEVADEFKKREADHLHGHDEADGCLCDIDHSLHEPTPDHEIPEATGGVEGERIPRKPRRKGTRTAVEGEA